MCRKLIIIGNKEDSMKIIIAGVSKLNEDGTIETSCILNSGGRSDYYTSHRIGYTRFYRVRANKDKQVRYFVACEPSEADLIGLGHLSSSVDYKHIVETCVDGDPNKFTTREKIYIQSHKDEVSGLPIEPRYNDILGVTYIKHVPCEDPKFEGDCDTVFSIQNKKVEYYKEFEV